MIWVLFAMLGIMNVSGFFMMGVDKQRARKNRYRISESTLWTIAFFGGALGATAGMKHYRHKTKHVQFKYGLPILAVIEVVVVFLLIRLFS